MIETLLTLIAGVALLYFVIWLSIWIVILLPARMAKERGRSAVFWVLVSVACSPLVAILLLWVLGGHPDLAGDGNVD